MAALQFIAGIILITLGAEVLIRGASHLALDMGITPLVVGLTVVAFGTSSPELAVAIQGVLTGASGVSNGNIIGSNIFNSLVILGLAAVVTPLAVHREIFRIQIPVVIGASLLLFVLAMDGTLSQIEGILLACLAVGYVAFTVRQGRREARENHVAEQLEFESLTDPDRLRRAIDLLLRLAMVAVGLAMLVFGSDWLVAGAVTVAQSIGVSDFLIGVTIIAAGTSLPEVATTIMAGIRGERDIAIGNAIGSSILNILVVFGLSSGLSPRGIPFEPSTLGFDLPVMLACAVLLFPVVFSKREVSRLEGGLLLIAYLAYIFYIVLAR